MGAGAKVDNVVVLPDIVFSLADEKALRAAATSIEARPLRIAVSVRETRKFFRIADPEIGRTNYHDSVRSLVEHLVLGLGADVTFLSTCQGIAEYRLDDSAIALEIVRALRPEVRTRVNVDRLHPTRLG